MFKSIVFIGNYLPRICGIATFTTDLLNSIKEVTPQTDCWAIALNDNPEGYEYSNQVRFEINQNQLSDYKLASEFLNMNRVDLICLQHEYGIFGGPSGSNIIGLLSNLKMPVITTLHTVLSKPTQDQKDVLIKIANISDKLIVMSQKAIEILKKVYNIPKNKITFIHHGTPDNPFTDSNYYKDHFGVEGKKVILTFGLLSQNKGIEYAIMAMPEILKKHPDVVYIILGKTHPHVLKNEGESYRLKLQQLSNKLGVSENIIFQNRFVNINELSEFLGMADIYITPYLNEEQITSGTLIYAMSTGKATISTPYWYAKEMLDDDRGILIPFKDPKAIAEKINYLLDNEIEFHAIRKRAYLYCRNAIWKEVAQSYLNIFSEVKIEREHNPHLNSFVKKSSLTFTSFQLPEINLNHLKILTDDTGIMQHATYNIPNRSFGYCTDDNARALICTSMGSKFSVLDESTITKLTTTYLSFLQSAFNKKNGRFKNFMSYDRKWEEEIGSDDSNGRAMWGLGVAVANCENPGHLAMAANLFNLALKATTSLKSPRAIAFTLVGIHEYLRRFSGDRDVKRVREILAYQLFKQFKDNYTNEWPWLEDIITYANGKIPQALLLSGQWIQNNEMIEIGLKSLKWLIKIQTKDAHFVPIGNNGWYHKNKEIARFDQQPIEAQSIIDASIEAYNATQDKKWLEPVMMCFRWFLEDNDLKSPLYDPATGGCRDGLMPNEVNQNEGAESTLAWLLSLISLHKLYTDQILDVKMNNKTQNEKN